MNTILKIGTSHCPPCKMLKPIYDNLKEEYRGKINFLEASDDGEYEIFEKYCKKFNVRGVPVVIIMDSEENELERLTGLQTKEVYCEIIEKYI